MQNVFQALMGPICVYMRLMGLCKLQEKLFYLYRTPNDILFDV